MTAQEPLNLVVKSVNVSTQPNQMCVTPLSPTSITKPPVLVQDLKLLNSVNELISQTPDLNYSQFSFQPQLLNHPQLNSNMRMDINPITDINLANGLPHAIGQCQPLFQVPTASTFSHASSYPMTTNNIGALCAGNRENGVFTSDLRPPPSLVDPDQLKAWLQGVQAAINSFVVPSLIAQNALLQLYTSQFSLSNILMSPNSSECVNNSLGDCASSPANLSSLPLLLETLRQNGLGGIIGNLPQNNIGLHPSILSTALTNIESSTCAESNVSCASLASKGFDKAVQEMVEDESMSSSVEQSAGIAHQDLIKSANSVRESRLDASVDIEHASVSSTAAKFLVNASVGQQSTDNQYQYNTVDDNDIAISLSPSRFLTETIVDMPITKPSVKVSEQCKNDRFSSTLTISPAKPLVSKTTNFSMANSQTQVNISNFGKTSTSRDHAPSGKLNQLTNAKRKSTLHSTTSKNTKMDTLATATDTTNAHSIQSTLENVSSKKSRFVQSDISTSINECRRAGYQTTSFTNGNSSMNIDAGSTLKFTNDSPIQTEIDKSIQPTGANRSPVIFDEKSPNVSQNELTQQSFAQALDHEKSELPSLTNHLSPSGIALNEVGIAVNSRSQSPTSPTFRTMRRVMANARERTRVHTITSAFEALRNSVPTCAETPRLSKLAVLRVACCYINALATCLERYDTGCHTGNDSKNDATTTSKVNRINVGDADSKNDVMHIQDSHMISADDSCAAGDGDNVMADEHEDEDSSDENANDADGVIIYVDDDVGKRGGMHRKTNKRRIGIRFNGSSTSSSKHKGIRNRNESKVDKLRKEVSSASKSNNKQIDRGNDKNTMPLFKEYVRKLGYSFI